MAENRPDQLGFATFHTLAFSTRQAAEQAYEDFVGLGVSPDDISLFVHAEPPADRREDTALDHDIDVGGAVGAGVSSLAGGAGGLPLGEGIKMVTSAKTSASTTLCWIKALDPTSAVSKSSRGVHTADEAAARLVAYGPNSDVAPRRTIPVALILRLSSWFTAHVRTVAGPDRRLISGRGRRAGLRSVAMPALLW